MDASVGSSLDDKNFSVIDNVIDLEKYPINQPDSPQYQSIVAQCRADLENKGMYELPGFLKPDALRTTIAKVLPRMANDSVEIRREHNIYFLDKIEGIADDHPALKKILTINHTLCADQIVDTPLTQIYEWLHFRNFIARTMQLPVLHLMDDELARLNILSYRPGEALNWHFDRSEFTVTLLLQRAEQDGIFEYRRKLRTDFDPNYDGVGKLIAGLDQEVISVDVEPGALNVFHGHNTAHRVTTVSGNNERMVAVFSLYEKPGVRFSDSENMGFYRRTHSRA